MARVLFGDRWFPLLGRWYRAMFVDLEKVVQSLPPFPPGARVLDIGGGDGDMINILLRRNPDLDVTMIDLSPRLGAFLEPELRRRVRLLPSTSLKDYAATDYQAPDFVLVSDVIHHVPLADRLAFFGDLRLVLAGRRTTLVIKDIEPGHFRARLSEWADRYVSGDHKVSLVSRADVVALVNEVFPRAEAKATGLYEIDAPNYSIVFSIDAT
jgi:cyclopropane fatty-acyl-phospholipid synthase-like methyltransferase